MALAGTFQPTRTVTSPPTTMRSFSPATISIFPRTVDTSIFDGPVTSNVRSNGNRCAYAACGIATSSRDTIARISADLIRASVTLDALFRAHRDDCRVRHDTGDGFRVADIV